MYVMYILIALSLSFKVDMQRGRYLLYESHNENMMMVFYYITRTCKIILHNFIDHEVDLLLYASL